MPEHYQIAKYELNGNFVECNSFGGSAKDAYNEAVAQSGIENGFICLAGQNLTDETTTARNIQCVAVSGVPVLQSLYDA